MHYPSSQICHIGNSSLFESSVYSYDLVYLYHTYCCQTIQLQERVAGSQQWRFLRLNLLIALVQVPPFLYNPTGHVKTGKINIISQKAEIS
jgi:hypothetical protein